jgi:uncharacterized protein
MGHRHRITTALLIASAVLYFAIPSIAAAVETPVNAGTTAHHYQVIFQVSDGDLKRWNLALGNIRNVQEELGRDNVDIELVAYGPGIGMLSLDSEVGERVGEAIDRGVRVVACENTMKAVKLGRDDMLPRIDYVKAGVVEIVARQTQGYQYVRP